MILDSLLQFDASNNLAQVTGTYNSTNIIDLGGPNLPVLANLQGARDIGIGDDPAMKLLVQVTTTFTSGGAGTLAVNFQGNTDNGSGAPTATWTTWYTSPTFALATLIVGARLMDMDMPRPPAGVAIPRFLRLTYVVGGATMTAGTVEALIVLDRHDQYYSSTVDSTLGGYPAGIYINN